MLGQVDDDGLDEVAGEPVEAPLHLEILVAIVPAASLLLVVALCMCGRL